MKIHLSSQIVPISAVAVTSSIGFAVAFQSAPHLAWGRLFIDLSVILSLFFLGFSLRKRPSEDALQVTSALRELGRGRFDTRVSAPSKDESSDLINAFNELAINLSQYQNSKIEPSFSPVSQHLHRKSILRSPESHSFHPELGPVKTLSLMRDTLSQYSSIALAAKSDYDVSNNSNISDLQEIDSSTDNSTTVTSDKVDTVKDDYLNNIDDLFTQYTRARAENNLAEVSLEVFKKTIEESRKVLITQHDCKSIKFEVVSGKGEVALRPRLIR